MDIKADKPSDEDLSPRGHNPLYLESTDNNVAALWAAHNGRGEAIHAHNRSPNQATIAAYNLDPNSGSPAIFAKKEGSVGTAGFFVGDVWVERNLAAKGNLRTGASIFTDGGIVAKQGARVEGGMGLFGELRVYGRILEIHRAADEDSKAESEPETESLLQRVRRLEEEVSVLRSRLTSK